MPRENIWTLFFWLLDMQKARTQYVYHRALGYGDWLSRDPQRPRLVYKLSGLARLSDRRVNPTKPQVKSFSEATYVLSERGLRAAARVAISTTLQPIGRDIRIAPRVRVLFPLVVKKGGDAYRFSSLQISWRQLTDFYLFLLASKAIP
jgi:hypothetical protein